NFVVIVRRDRQRHRPDEAVLQFGGWPSVSLIGPHLNIARLPIAQIEAFDDAADAPRTGSARPDDVVVNRIGRGPAALTASHRLPRAPRNSSASTTASATASAAVTRPAIRWPILFVAVDVVWNLIINRCVIDLRNRKLDAFPGAPACDGDGDAAIIRDGHPAWIGRINPHVVIVSARTAGE